ncbi:helix-turn-helix domain-containing protein [Lactiplantibacillus garii]|uniref:Helix-turn-helix domain-containing protein n=1 Tax=Lactiplantibacillus garii TaxID=2306423 RepID=A0A426DAE2_9LACO|nr:helix-turn-helix transcriptional regulator [Lactiplantibacillus garii]RRK11486.1 helix-turn-helix domain-containing protein [Lactiplantibacillus garii]
MKIEVGQKIKEQRGQRAWSQQELAEQLNVTRQTVSKWELGKSYPDLEGLVALTQLFEVSADCLLGLTVTVSKCSWFSVLFRRGSRDTMGEDKINKPVKWYAGGQDRAKVATAIMMDLVAHLNTTTEKPFRELVGQYYSELIRQQSGSNIYVFDRMGLDFSKCLRQNGIKLSPENSARVDKLLQLNYIRYM